MDTVESLVLPAGLRARPLSPDDAPAVYEVIAAAEAVDLDDVLIELEDILGDWQRLSLDFERDTLAVLDEDRLVAFAELSANGRAEVSVHPSHRGRGIGTHVVGWTEDRMRTLGHARVGQTVPATCADAVDLLQDRGYRQLWTSWVLELAPDAEIRGDGAPPDGVVVRPCEPGQEPAAFQVIEDAFNEWPERPPSTYEDWAAPVLSRPGFEPWQLLVADEGDEVVGVCHVVVSGDSVWVNQLAVRGDRRGRGLGRVLLVSALREGRARGARRAELSTDSRTGALGLYEHVGMSVTATFLHFVLDLRGS